MKLLKPNSDPIFRGLIAGLIAGTLKDIPDIFLCELTRVKQFAFWDYVGEMIFNRIPHTFLEHFLCFLIQVAFSVGLGVIFTAIVSRLLPTKYPWLLGLIYGGSCWFVLISILKLYHITLLFPRDLLTPSLTLLFSAGYGLILVAVNERMKPKDNEVRIIKQ